MRRSSRLSQSSQPASGVVDASLDIEDETRQFRYDLILEDDCNCRLCSLPLPDLQISDARRLQIQLLDNAIGNSDRLMNKPDDCLAGCHCLLQVLEEEYKGSAGALIARLYYDAFQISITHGD